MRQVATIADERLARKLADYLLTLDVTNRIVQGKDGWIVWVHREEQTALAKREVEAFLADPDDPRYQGAAKVARTVRREKAKVERRHARATRFLAGRLNAPSFARCPVTYTLIGLSIAVAMVTSLGYDVESDIPLVLSPPTVAQEWRTEPPITDADGRVVIPPGRHLEPAYHRTGLDALARGQIWRLFTPMLLHFGPVHLAFNMVMLYRLGGLVELRKGRVKMLLLVAATAAASSLAQYYWELKRHGPDDYAWLSGGMSGVLYGLFGYCWMKSDYDAETDMKVPNNLILWMGGWLFFCMTGAIGPIGNAAHVGGLVSGLLIGVAPHLVRDRWW